MWYGETRNLFNITKKEKNAIRFIGIYYLNKLKDVYIWNWRLKKKEKLISQEKLM